MLNLPGYSIESQIYESSNSLVYRGVRRRDRIPAIVKLLKQDYPNPTEIIRYKQEYAIAQHLEKIDGTIAVYDFIPYERTFAIVFEDFGAISLKNWLQGKPLPVKQFLPLAIEIVRSLGAIHSQNIIHKDINSANIVINPETQQVKIIDFGISTQLSLETPICKNPQGLEGTLAYISPEQTGRMNRYLDYRTDFYSLGVTFYELLTGTLPFVADDALELLHCHIARKARSAHDLYPQIPLALSNIVTKMMAKTAEDRYQSAWGIVADLEACWQQLQIRGHIEPFTLATGDVSDRFAIPQKLYGREGEIATLLAAFDRVAKGEASRELMLVAGYSGIGKSALVQEIYKPITKAKGYFISGKFDQFQRNIPFSAVVDAFTQLVRQLLTESAAELDRWREKLLMALGVNAGVIVEVIPEVELIVGPQPPVPELGPAETQNRFNLVFQDFIRAFCDRGHPLVIFLDDLQWADAASLKLMELMMTDADAQYLLLIGAYRDNEVSPTHPLILTLENIRKQEATVDQITLTSLTLAAISQLIADTLHADRAEVRFLAALVLDKTGGNPFFVNEFLKTLYAEQLLKFDLTVPPAWRWDLDRIEAANITDNVVDLTIGKIQKLPPQTQQVLQWAACIGAQFDLDTLAMVADSTAKKISQDLMPGLGLILPLTSLDDRLLVRDYRFAHDRIQQAAASMLSGPETAAIHLKIGRQLWHALEDPGEDTGIFAIVDHLDRGIELVTNPQERNEIAQLNLLAGEQAKHSSAYHAAVNYLEAGLSLLEADAWESNYDLKLALSAAAVEAHYLNINYPVAATLAAEVLQRGKTMMDKLDVYISKILFSAAQNQMFKAIETGLEALSCLGVTLVSEQPPALDLEALETMPEMLEADKQAALRICMILFAPIYTTKPDLLPALAFTMVDLCVRYGNSPLAAYAYGLYGLLLCGALNEIPLGYQFGKLALRILDRFAAKEIQCRVYNKFYSFILHWREPTINSLEPLRQTIQIGLETGEIEFACYATVNYAANLVLVGEPLDYVGQEHYKYLQMLEKLEQEYQLFYTKIWAQLVLNLRNEAPDKQQLTGTIFDEEKILPILIENNNLGCLYGLYIGKTILNYLFSDYQTAAANAKLAAECAIGVVGLFPTLQLEFYSSLVFLALYPQEDYLEQVAANQDKLRHWASYAPSNFQHKYDLVAAENARVLGDNWQAAELYEQAIAGARENGYIHEEALAYELAAQFYLRGGMTEIAQTYMRNASYCYLRWGATAKVEDLQLRYPQLLVQLGESQTVASATTVSTTSTTSTDSQNTGKNLDLTTVIKASQAIAREINLDRLLETLMKLVMANAGARSGYLILERDGNWAIAAGSRVGEKGIETLQGLSLEAVSEAIVNYAIRTRESVVLRDASKEGPFTEDSQIIAKQGKSILCIPLQERGKLIGVLYLENDLVTGAFTSDRVELLQLLAGQGAIAIENARLYRQVQERERRLTQFIEAVPIGISVIEATGQVTYVNFTGEQILGQGENPQATAIELSQTYQVYQAKTNRLYPTEQLPAVRALKGETVHTEDLEIHHPDGRIIPLEVHTTPVLDDRGKIISAINAFQDITDRLQAQDLLADYNRTLEAQIADRTAELTQTRDFLQAIVDNIPVMLCFYKDGVDVQLINQAFEETLGWSLAEMREIDIMAECFPDPDYRAEVLAFMNKADGTWRDFEQRTRTGEMRFTSWANIRLADGSTVGIGQDITARKQGEIELERAKVAADAANAAKSAFIANMSHELRTPLNAILGFSQILDRTPLNAEQQENISIIARSGEHLLTLINQVLDLSKIEAGRMTLNENDFDLPRLLDEIEDMFQFKAQQQHLQLLFELDSHVPRYLRTDGLKLRQVLINLLNNALKFTKEGGVSLRVKCDRILAEKPVGAKHSGRQMTNKEEKLTTRMLRPAQTDVLGEEELEERLTISFEVEDSGPGIAPEELQQLFAAFSQTSTGKHAQEGTGLGLAIARKFVQLMGGDITVESVLGRGSIFKFHITARAVDAADIETAQPQRRIIALGPDQPRYRLLIVDDKPTNRQLLIKLLNPFGFELQEASNGEEAIALWSSFEPQLIFMDLRMPVMDGYEATKQIKSTDIGQATAIIAVTASAFEEQKKLVLSAGFDEFIRKPFRETDIFTALETHLGVKFIYEETVPEATEDTTEEILTPEALAALPPELLGALERGAIECDLEELERTIDAIVSYHPSVGSQLRRLVENFDFDGILLHKIR